MLEALASKSRDKKAAMRFLRKRMKPHGRAGEIVTDGLKSSSAACNTSQLMI